MNYRTQHILKESNAELELRIHERTAELHAVNIELAQTLIDLKQSERKVVQQERLSAMGELASGASHNLNNLLTPAALLIGVVLDDPTLSETSRNTLKLIESSTADAAELVNRLGSFYGNSNSISETTNVDMKFLMSEVGPLTKAKWHDEPRKSGLEICLDLRLDEVPFIHGNESELRQVFTNLVFNAVDAMPSGGVIGLRLFHEKDVVVVEVSDNGQGMTGTEQRKCFEPFFTSKHSGSGLGLSTCVGVIERHSGIMTVNSELGHGTTFRIDLPLAAAAAVSNDPHPSKAVHGHMRPRRILYIDDDAAVRRAVVLLLESQGHGVEAAENGTAGMLAVYENDYDIVITDYSMPEMSGREVAAAVKAHRPETRVVLVSGWPDSQLRPAANENAKEDCILKKPFKIDQLNRAMENI